MASSNGRVTSRLGPLATPWLASCGLGAALVLLPFAARAQVTRLDVAPGGAPANGITALMPVVSFDGRYVAFASTASNLVPGDADATYDFFRHDAQTTQLIRGDFPAAVPSTVRLIVTAISYDGRWLLFNSPEAEWVAGDTNLAADAFQYDFTTGQVRRVSVGSGSVQAEGSSSRSR